MRPRTAHATQSDTIECECEMTSQSHHHERWTARTVTRHLRGRRRFMTLPTTPSPTLHWRASSHCLIRTAITSFLRPVGRWEPFRKNSTTCQRKTAASGGGRHCLEIMRARHDPSTHQNRTRRYQLVHRVALTRAHCGASPAQAASRRNRRRCFTIYTV